MQSINNDNFCDPFATLLLLLSAQISCKNGQKMCSVYICLLTDTTVFLTSRIHISHCQVKLSIWANTDLIEFLRAARFFACSFRQLWQSHSLSIQNKLHRRKARTQKLICLYSPNSAATFKKLSDIHRICLFEPILACSRTKQAN